MDKQMKRGVAPLAWLFYLVIVFEIVYMISPFALYYYSAYGPSLNFLHRWPQTAWLSGFFLPHFSETSSWLLNLLHNLGWKLFLAALILFLIGAGHIYYAKFAKKGAVSGGLYKLVRHPQYTAFAMMGIGVLLVWPRFTVLMMYVTMLFVYYWLARKEERECEEKFGEGFRAYLARTPMFIPVRFSIQSKPFTLPKSGPKRIAANLLLYIVVMVLAAIAGRGVRNYSLANLSVLYTNDMATIATALMSKDDMEKTLHVALDHPEVQGKLTQAGYGAGERLLNYIVPLSWFLPDLPLEVTPQGARGHHQPKSFNRDEYKILFTKAKLSTDGSVSDADIIKKTVARAPIVVVKVNKASGEILGIETPPPHVRWGDIPTPLF
jgi:protein-S-isoprenylcysteine O-methyltransferase Ste14